MVYQSGDNGKAKRFLNEGLSAVASKYRIFYSFDEKSNFLKFFLFFYFEREYY